MDYTKAVPLKVDNRWNDIFLSYWDLEEKKKKYEKIQSFKHYFYESSTKKPIISKMACTKHYIDKSWTTRQESQAYPNSYEGDVPFYRRFLIDNFGTRTVLETVPLTVAFLDIECYVAGRIDFEGKFPITAITMYDTKSRQYATFSWHEEEEWKDKENKFFVFKNEAEMFENFLQYYESVSPDILTGWNFIGYDNPNLCNRLKKFNLVERLSPFGIVDPIYRSKAFNIFGVSCVDYMDLYEKYMMKALSSKALDKIAQIELGEGKVKYKGDLNQLWKTDLKKFLEYNRKDVELIVRIDEKKKFLDILNEVRNIGVVNFEDVLHNSIVLDNLIIRILNRKGFVVQ